MAEPTRDRSFCGEPQPATRSVPYQAGPSSPEFRLAKAFGGPGKPQADEGESDTAPYLCDGIAAGDQGQPYAECGQPDTHPAPRGRLAGGAG